MLSYIFVTTVDSIWYWTIYKKKNDQHIDILFPSIVGYRLLNLHFQPPVTEKKKNLHFISKLPKS